MEPTKTEPASHRPPKRVVIPAILLALLTIFIARAVVRGTWADTEVRNPQTSAEGVVRQLILSPNGAAKQVRLAIVVDRPIDAAWKVLTDYDHLHEALPHLAPVKATQEPGKATIRLTGTVTSFVMDIPFEVPAVHDDHGKERQISWNGQLDERMLANSGAWLLTDLGDGRTLVVYVLHVDIHPFPRWLVRYVLLNRLRPALYHLRGAIEQRFPR